MDEALVRAISHIERDLYWAQHIAAHGTNPAQRERGNKRVDLFTEELQRATAAGIALHAVGNGFIGRSMRGAQ